LAELVDLLSLSPDSFRERLVGGLSGDGYAVFPDLLRPEILDEVRRDMDELRSAHAFRPASVGKGLGTQLAPETRGDGTLWFEPEALTPAQAKIVVVIESIRGDLNAALYLGLWDWEGHYAVYPPGAFYRRHLDRFASDSRRTVSVVFFLNSVWAPAAAGALRMETKAGPLEILPLAGTAVFFMSDQIPHEVLETRRDRYSFAGWFRTRV
jgi:SM-20-related protein